MLNTTTDTIMEEQDLARLKSELEKFKKGEKITGRSRTTPLGKLFQEISNKIGGYETQSNAVQYLYKKFSGEENISADKIQQKKVVVDKILAYLDKINELSMKKDDSTMISIPLYDIRIVGDLTHLIVLHGVYSILPNEYIIPLELRKLKSFKTAATYEKVDFNAGISILDDILEKFTGIFESDSDLKDLILVGTGFTDVLTIALVLYTKTGDRKYEEYVKRLERQSSTYQLLSFYSILFKYSLLKKKDEKFTKMIMSHLSATLMKPNGVESLIDLVMGLREDEEIDIAKVNYVVQVLISSKPAAVSLIDYYKNIFSQTRNLLVFVNRPLMNTVLAEIIVNIYGKNKRIVVDFLFKDIWTSLDPEEKLKKLDPEAVVITNEVELNNAFNVCISLSRSISATNKVIINEFFEPIIIPLWYYSNYQRFSGKDFDIVLNLLKNVLVLGDFDHFLALILDHLVDYQLPWTFDGTEGLTFIKVNTNENIVSKENMILQLFEKIDFNVETFVKLTEKLNETDSKYLHQVVTTALGRLVGQEELSVVDLPMQKIVNLKLIQSLLDKFKSDVESSPISLLMFVNTYLNRCFDPSQNEPTGKIINAAEVDSDDEDEDQDEDHAGKSDNLEAIDSLTPILEIIATLTPTNIEEKSQYLQLQATLRKNRELLPSSICESVSKIIGLDVNAMEVKKSKPNFDLESCLKQLNDQTPSIRAHALDKLTMYIVEPQVEQSEEAVSTKYAVNLLVTQLRDPEPFVYLNAIKNLTVILSFDMTYMNHIIDLYSNSKRSIDEKLRLGEAITKVVSSKGKVFNPEQVKILLNVCISIARANSEVQQKSEDNKDVRMRMSALSLIGLVCSETGFGIAPYVDEIADLVQGVITFEKNPELRRAAVVIISDLVRNEKGLDLIKKYGQKLQTLLEYISDKDQDLLVCQFADNTLVNIEDAFEKRFNISG